MAGQPINTDGGDFDMPQEAAAILGGVTVQSLHLWRKQENPPPWNADGSIPARAFGKWLIEHRSQKRRGAPRKERSPDDTGDDRNEAERRLALAKAIKAERENDVEAGRLLPVEEVEEIWQKILSRVKSRLLKIPSALAPLVLGNPDVHSIQSKIKDAVHDALTELVEKWQDEADEDDE